MIQPNTYIPELISLTELRYKTKKLQKILSEEGNYVILTARGKKIAIMYPVETTSKPKELKKPPTYNMGEMKRAERDDIYGDYLDAKFR